MRKRITLLATAAALAMSTVAAPAATAGPIEDVDNCIEDAITWGLWLNFSAVEYYCTMHLLNSVPMNDQDKEQVARCVTYKSLPNCEPLLP
jgi:hypothetical protein